MKNLYLILLLVAIANIASAQTGNVGIGTSSPDASSILDVNSATKGLLIPRVELTATNNASPITSPATSLIVYNTKTTGAVPYNVTPGYYYWDGSKWVKVLTSTPNTLDLGYMVGWTSNTAPPDYLLPLTGGTYNWSDFPDFQTLHASYPCQFIASSTSTTFTLENINTAGRFLRGSTVAGTDQAYSTALPSTSFTTNTTGAHVHSINPPSTTTSTNGAHNHGRGGTGSVGNGNWGLIQQSSGGNNTSNSVDASPGEPNILTSPRELGLATDGNHSHTVDIATFNSASNGDHSHTISGGDAETRPINTSVIWCIKVKPTGTSGSLTINNTANQATNGLSVYGSAIGLGGSLNQSTTINQTNYPLAFTSTATNGFSVDGTTLSVDAVNNRIGLGTAAPGYMLDIAGKTSIDGATDGTIYMEGTKNKNRGLEWYYGANDRYGIAQATGGNTALYTAANFGGSFISFNLANAVGTPFTELMRISHNGDVQVNNLAGTGNRPIYADATGVLNTVSSNNRVAYLVDRSQKTQDGTNAGFRTVGGTTSNLSVNSGDVIVINISLKFAFTGGSGGDDVKFRLNIGGCATTTQTESYNYENFDNDRDEYQPLSMQFVYTATCNGDINFQLSADNNSAADDNSKYGDLVIVATKY